jgi:hypothetical protein
MEGGGASSDQLSSEGEAMSKSQHVSQRRMGHHASGYSVTRILLLVGILLGVLAALLLAEQLMHRANGAEPKPTAKPAADPYAWQTLFDGRSLKGWKVPNFGGEGEVKVVNGEIHVAMGNSMSGVTWTGKPPRTDFELELEAKRTDGNDFFATTTFPVGKDPCSLVIGGWGGTVVGLSCVDFYDASDNMTTKFMDFKNNQWYKVRIQVTKAKIEAWVDDEKVVDLDTKGHRISIRDECDLCQPLGVSTWCSGAALRNIRMRQIKPE